MKCNKQFIIEYNNYITMSYRLNTYHMLYALTQDVTLAAAPSARGSEGLLIQCDSCRKL